MPIVASLSFLVALIGTALAASAPALQDPAPHRADKQPDFSGIWLPDGEFIGDTAGTSPPSKNDSPARCLPIGMPGTARYPWRIVQTPTQVFLRFEGRADNERQIFMDGRAHPPKPDPSWHGHSTGRYDGDTLVVDTIGFNDQFWFDIVGHPHTEQLHTVERITRPDPGSLVVEVTIDDPGAYPKPFTITSRSTLVPENRLIEYVCPDNKKPHH